MINEQTILNSNVRTAQIDMGPLIDMVFILLIFFIITTNFTRQTGIDVSKPKAQSAIIQGQKIMMVGISREGSIHVYGRQIHLDALEQLVKREISKKPDLSVVIIADRGAEIGKAVSVMDRCAIAGVNKVSIAADK